MQCSLTFSFLGLVAIVCLFTIFLYYFMTKYRPNIFANTLRNNLKLNYTNLPEFENVEKSQICLGLVSVTKFVVKDAAATKSAIVFAHGGGFVGGFTDSIAMSRLTYLTKLPVYSVNYTTAPKGKFPVPIVEIINVANSVEEESVILMGDSAGAFHSLHALLANDEQFNNLFNIGIKIDKPILGFAGFFGFYDSSTLKINSTSFNKFYESMAVLYTHDNPKWFNPLLFVDRVKVPIFLVDGPNSFWVDALQMANANRNIETVILTNCELNHDFYPDSIPESRLIDGRLMDWLTVILAK